MNRSPALGARKLGHTGLTVSLMGLGSGGPSQLGQRRGTDIGAVRHLVQTALDLGVNLIDTAPGYGASEELLGKAMQGLPVDDLVICTKFNPVGPDKQLRPASDLRESLDRSLRHLGRDAIDVFYLHAVPADMLSSVMDVFGDPLTEVVDRGLVRFTGVSEQYVDDHEHRTIIQGLEKYDFDVVMVGYNLLSPSAGSTVFPLAKEKHVGVVIMCAVRGVIADPVRLEAVIRNWTLNGWLDPTELPESTPLGWLLDEADSIAAAAYKFSAEPDAVGCVLTGTASADHLVENVQAISGKPLSPASIRRLRETFEKVGRNVGPADANTGD